MRGQRKKTYIKQMFVVEKNNDIKFTFDDRSALLQKTKSIVTSLSQPPLFKTRGFVAHRRPLSSQETAKHKKASSRKVPGRG